MGRTTPELPSALGDLPLLVDGVAIGHTIPHDQPLALVRLLGEGHALLAALFHPDGPNDLAPSGYNAGLPTPDLPDSPLQPNAPQPGLRW